MMAPKITFHKDFKNPSAKERSSALGPFPFEHKSNSSRERMLRKSVEFGYQPSLLLDFKREEDITSLAGNENENTKSKKDTSDDIEKEEEDTKSTNPRRTITSYGDLDSPQLYIPTPRSETSKAISKPSDDLDWLAQVPEEGQTFEQYISFLTTRTTGRIRQIANPDGLEILLLPIVLVNEKPKHANPSGISEHWPNYGPPLNPLLQYSEAFFDRKVRLLPSAAVYVDRKTDRREKRRKTGKKKEVGNVEVGAFATSTAKGQLKLYLPEYAEGKYQYSKPINIAGRCDFSSDRIQIQVTSLLDELSRFRYSRQEKLDSKAEKKDFCIMGITMIDLYDGPKDLFCAGMAFGGDKVAAFSFHRYHPFIKMHPEQWHNYGYVDDCDGYSYYEDGNQNPKGYKHDPQVCSGSKIKSEYLRRSSKLLTHELGHLFAIDHCIHNRCLMNGTGHLVEDFKAPSHLCGVCLRKLQWRAGFDVRQRYKLLSIAFDEMGMETERRWVRKQFDHLMTL